MFIVSGRRPQQRPVSGRPERFQLASSNKNSETVTPDYVDSVNSEVFTSTSNQGILDLYDSVSKANSDTLVNFAVTKQDFATDDRDIVNPNANDQEDQGIHSPMLKQRLEQLRQQMEEESRQRAELLERQKQQEKEKMEQEWLEELKRKKEQEEREAQERKQQEAARLQELRRIQEEKHLEQMRKLEEMRQRRLEEERKREEEREKERQKLQELEKLRQEEINVKKKLEELRKQEEFREKMRQRKEEEINKLKQEEEKQNKEELEKQMKIEALRRLEELKAMEEERLLKLKSEGESRRRKELEEKLKLDRIREEENRRIAEEERKMMLEKLRMEGERLQQQKKLKEQRLQLEEMARKKRFEELQAQLMKQQKSEMEKAEAELRKQQEEKLKIFDLEKLFNLNQNDDKEMQVAPSRSSEHKMRPNIHPTRNKPIEAVKADPNTAFASITIEDVGANDDDYELGPGGIVKLKKSSGRPKLNSINIEPLESPPPQLEYEYEYYEIDPDDLSFPPQTAVNQFPPKSSNFPRKLTFDQEIKPKQQATTELDNLSNKELLLKLLKESNNFENEEYLTQLKSIILNKDDMDVTDSEKFTIDDKISGQGSVSLVDSNSLNSAPNNLPINTIDTGKYLIQD